MGTYSHQPSRYMSVNSADAVGNNTNTRWPSTGYGAVVASASAASSEVATAALTAIESILILVADAAASTITLRNHADSATLPGGAIAVPALADINCPYEINFGHDGLPVAGGFSVDISAATLSFLVFYRRVA